MEKIILIPKLFSVFRNYDRHQFLSDTLAGLIVGIVAIPLALAFGIASGVGPERGLYAAIVGGFLVSFLGGSRVQIGGPTGAFVVVIYSIVQQYGEQGLAICTIMAGIILLVMGFAGMGSMIKYIPYPVITGFTSGIAVIIFSSQIKDLFGLEMALVPTEFLEKWQHYAMAASSFSWEAAGLSLLALAIIFLWPKVTTRIPAPIVALIVVTMAAQAGHLPVETIASKFGQLPRGLPSPSWPQMDWGVVVNLIRPATTVAMLAAIESLLSAIVADGMIGSRHRSNMELVAQGVANMGSVIFGGIAVTGAIARTATNVKSGGRSPVAGMIHAVVVLLALLIFGPWVSMVPLCALAAILVVVSYHMSEWRSFRALLKAPRSDVAVLLTTFGLTVLADLTVAVEVGMVLSAFLFMRRMAQATEVKSFALSATDEDENSRHEHLRREIPKDIEVYDINGPLFFGAADKLGEVLSYIREKPKVFILGMRHVPVIDATGLRALEQFQKRCRQSKIPLILSGLRDQPAAVLKGAGKFGQFDRILESANLKDALTQARSMIETKSN